LKGNGDNFSHEALLGSKWLDLIEFRALPELATIFQKHDTVEQIVTRLSFEPGIAAVSWAVAPTMME
jgi:hypothetical protein